jgi:hypothetical protein
VPLLGHSTAEQQRACLAMCGKRRVRVLPIAATGESDRSHLERFDEPMKAAFAVSFVQRATEAIGIDIGLRRLKFARAINRTSSTRWPLLKAAFHFFAASLEISTDLSGQRRVHYLPDSRNFIPAVAFVALRATC